MDIMKDLVQQIQDQTLNTKAKLEQCNTEIKRGLKAYKYDLLKKQAEIEKGLEARIAKTVEETKPEAGKYERFRTEKIATFNKIYFDTEHEMGKLLNNIQKRMDALKKDMDKSLEKMAMLVRETQEAVIKILADNIDEPEIMNRKCESQIETSTDKYDALNEETMKSLKFALEVFQQINKEVQVKSCKLADKNQQQYVELMKKFENKFEYPKFKPKNK